MGKEWRDWRGLGGMWSEEYRGELEGAFAKDCRERGMDGEGEECLTVKGAGLVVESG